MDPSKVLEKNSSNEIRCAGFFGILFQYSLKSVEFFSQVFVLTFGFATWVHKWQGYKFFFQVVSRMQNKFK